MARLAHPPLLVSSIVLALTGCGGDGGRQVVTVYVSDPVPLCGQAANGDCDEFDGHEVATAVGSLDPVTVDAETLRSATGLTWRAVRSREPLFVDLSVVLSAPPENAASYVVEVVDGGTHGRRLLSIASRDGMGLWVDGRFVMRSRYARRGTNRHSDVVAVDLDQPRTVLYRVLHGDGEWRLYREWWDPDRFDELLAYAIEVGAYADLPTDPVLADHDSVVHLKPPRVVVPDRPEVRFRWLTLLGEVLEEEPPTRGGYPETLPLPEAWRGAAVLETRVVDPADDSILYLEATPLFADSTARRLAAELVGRPAGDDEILEARQASVRRGFGLDGDSTPNSSTFRAYALVGLYRKIHDPDGFHRYPGPQVWGYRDDEGRVQPYWLVVPPDLDANSASRPLAFAVYHLTDPDFWRGRGAYSGQFIQAQTLSAAYGTFEVIPHLGGAQDFGERGTRELPAIVRQVASRLPVDTARVGLIVWSQHAVSAVRLALDPRVPLARLSMVVPAANIEALDPLLFTLHGLRPDLTVDLWSGELDDVVPPAYVESLAEVVRRQGIDARHVVVPHSTHLGGLLYDVLADLHRRLADPPGGSPSPPAP